MGPNISNFDFNFDFHLHLHLDVLLDLKQKLSTAKELQSGMICEEKIRLPPATGACW